MPVAEKDEEQVIPAASEGLGPADTLTWLLWSPKLRERISVV
jgi:hypothetical protein